MHPSAPPTEAEEEEKYNDEDGSLYNDDDDGRSAAKQVAADWRLAHKLLGEETKDEEQGDSYVECSRMGSFPALVENVVLEEEVEPPAIAEPSETNWFLREIAHGIHLNSYKRKNFTSSTPVTLLLEQTSLREAVVWTSASFREAGFPYRNSRTSIFIRDIVSAVPLVSLWHGFQDKPFRLRIHALWFS